MIDAAALRRRPPAIDRSRDRLVVVLAVGLAVAFLVAALGSALLPESVRRNMWLPLHLVLAGGATTAIAGVMPFFSAALAAAPPTDLRLRVGSVLTVAFGATSVAVGVVGSWPVVAACGGAAFVIGVVLVALATLRPLRSALGPSRGIVVQGYVVALAEVGTGATLATLYVAGWPPLTAVWGAVKPAHAWLNMVGFVSLVIATTLLHFFPTVVGARIAARPSTRFTVIGLAAGSALVALGFALDLDLIGRLGALMAIVGAVALGTYARQTWVTRGKWTTDRTWHLFAIGGLVSAMAWFGVGIAVAAGRVLVLGSAPTAWSIDAVMGPLVVGWIGLAVLASASHLLPAVGPGDMAAHARQRVILGRWSIGRLAVANVGVAFLSVGLPLDQDVLVVAGTMLVAASLMATGLLLVVALQVGVGRAAL
jgi:nitrite reductase (NO-forming)